MESIDSSSVGVNCGVEIGGYGTRSEKHMYRCPHRQVSFPSN